MSDTLTDDVPERRGLLWAEFLTLYLGVPVALTAAINLLPLYGIGVNPLGIALAALLVLAIHLLNRTPGFSWPDLLKGGVLRHWRIILAYAAVTATTLLALAHVVLDERMLFGLLLHRPELWAMVMLLYPIFSVIPQRLIYGPLFFHRYGRLFQSQTSLIVVNGVAFSLGHLFYQNWVALLVTFGGGVLMAWAWTRTQSFGLALVLHALSGQLIFTIGLGLYFYHGAIAR